MSNLFEEVKSYFKNNNIDKLVSVFKNLKSKLVLAREFSENEIFSLVGGDVFRDTEVECYFPEVYVPKHSSSLSTGDCLFSSVSLSVYGNNRFSDELRVLTCIELFLNARFYANHPIISKTLADFKELFQNFLSVFTCCVSDKAFHAFKDDKYCPIKLCKEEAVVCCEKLKFSSFLCICALSSVVGRCFTTYYPDKCAEIKYTKIFNDKNISPRGLRSKIMDNVSILFCRSFPLSKSDVFKPNHFVPLIHVKQHHSKKIVVKMPTVLNSVKKKVSLPSRFIHNYFKKSEKNPLRSNKKENKNEIDVVITSDAIKSVAQCSSANVSLLPASPVCAKSPMEGLVTKINNRVCKNRENEKCVDNISQMSFSPVQSVPTLGEKQYRWCILF